MADYHEIGGRIGRHADSNTDPAKVGVWVRAFKARFPVGRLPSGDSSGFRILNVFDMDSRPTIVKSVVESADSGIESAESAPDSAVNPLRIGLWVRVFSVPRPRI